MTLNGFLAEKLANKSIDESTQAFVKQIIDGKEEILTFARVKKIKKSGAVYLNRELATVKKDEKDADMLVFLVK